MINVEYNQLDPLLRATGHPDGDVNCETGYSPFPGNINQVRVVQNSLCICSFLFIYGYIRHVYIYTNTQYKHSSVEGLSSNTKVSFGAPFFLFTLRIVKVFVPKFYYRIGCHIL